MIVVAGIPLLTLATLTIQHALNVTQLLSDLTRKAAGHGAQTVLSSNEPIALLEMDRLPP